MTVLEALDKSQQRKVVKAATRLYKSGGQPSPPAEERPLRRYEQRQLARELGWRGSKAKRLRSPEQVAARVHKINQVLLIDEALGVAKERVDHPIRARVKGV